MRLLVCTDGYAHRHSDLTYEDVGTVPLLDELALRGDIDNSRGLWRNWNPALIGDPMGPDIFHLVAFIRSLFLQSQMTVGLLSNITGFLPVFVPGTPPKNVIEARNNFEVLTADQTVGVRDFVNELAGSQRLYPHGLLYPGTANLSEIQRQIDHTSPTRGRATVSPSLQSSSPIHPPRR